MAFAGGRRNAACPEELKDSGVTMAVRVPILAVLLSLNPFKALFRVPRWENLEDAHNPSSPIRRTGIFRPCSAVPDEKSPGSNHCRTCPSTSRMVQWIPFQKEGYNEGTAIG